jgi:hypothetical protein
MSEQEEQQQTTHPVRVLVREVGYAAIEENLAGQTIVVAKRGFGPGQPQLNPAGLDLEPESEELDNAQDQYMRGEVIYLLDDDYARHKKYGVVRDIEDEPSAEEDAAAEKGVGTKYLDPATASVEELAEWIRVENPTVNDVVTASNGDAAIAEKLLEAETQAKNGEPRAGVTSGLSSVIAKG